MAVLGLMLVGLRKRMPSKSCFRRIIDSPFRQPLSVSSHAPPRCASCARVAPPPQAEEEDKALKDKEEAERQREGVRIPEQRLSNNLTTYSIGHVYQGGSWLTVPSFSAYVIAYA